MRPISTFRPKLTAIGLIVWLSLGFVVPPALAADANLPPYEQSLRRLSAIVGALMYLDPLCNKTRSTAWFEQMKAVLEAENADETRARQLRDRFNRSYSTLARTYKSCNAQAEMITKIYHEEGQTLLTNLKLKHVR